jgi:lipid II:glycine glycyltransferase (peptidoglycan interpeptide bridge formation enzyme)
MRIDIVRTLPETDWRRFVDEHPQGNIFHTPEMFQVFSRTRGYRPELWAAARGDRVLALLLPVQITLKNGLFRPLTTRAVAYGSVLSSDGAEGGEALSALLRSYTRTAKGIRLFTELRNITDQNAIQLELNKRGFIYEDHLNYLIGLDRPEEQIWRSLERTRRQEIQRARRNGLLIEEVNEPQKLEIVYQLLQNVFKRVQVPLADISMFRAAFKILVPRGMQRIILARLGNCYIGTSLVLLYKKRIFGWYCGCNRSYSSYYPESYMYWDHILWGKEHRFSIFDLAGAGKPNEDYGPRRYKAKWGGILVNYGRNVYVHAPVRLKLCRMGYDLVRKYL